MTDEIILPPHPPLVPVKLSGVPKAPRGLSHNTTRPPRAVPGLQAPPKGQT